MASAGHAYVMMGREDTIHQILEEVAGAENTELTALPQLSRTIDTDAIQHVLESSEQARVCFEYAGYDVAVSNYDISVDER